MPGTGTNNGGRGSDISDPTHNAAQRPHPNQHHHIQELANTIRSKGHWYIGYLNLISSPAAARAHTSPCNNGVYHQPDDNQNCTAPAIMPDATSQISAESSSSTIRFANSRIVSAT